jgi:putative spermidine/putrescine transport system ATP-binding protein
MPALSLQGLTKRYGTTVAVDGLSLEVGAGESVALLGPSGCGKTTTLRMVAGLIEPGAGSIRLDGVDITRQPAYRRGMGYVFQSYALFPHMSVSANVGFGLDERGVGRAERDRRVGEALDLVRLSGLGHRKPKELSGGQQQRVALARALVIKPAVLLLDESLSNLDSKLRDAMRQEIRDIQRALSITTLFVTHDQIEAFTMCDRIAVMEKGGIAQIGSARDIYDAPVSRFVAQFVGRANVLPLTRTGDALSLSGVPVSVSSVPTGDVDLFIRPQLVRLLALSEPASGLDRFPGKVKRVSFVGERIEVVVDTAAGRIIVEPPAGVTPPDEGADIGVGWRPIDARAFRREVA